MRIVASADLHGDYELYTWLTHRIGYIQPDLVILAGDLLGYHPGYPTVEAAQQADAQRICELLAAVRVPIFYIMGNDDFIELEPRQASWQSLHNRRVEWGGYTFVGYQYSLPFMGGIFEKPEDAIETDLQALEAWVDAQTILVTHTPAWGILDVGVLDVSAGSRALQSLIQQCRPLLHIHGHIHQHFGRVGNHFNVAAGGQQRAMLIEVPSLRHEIVYDG